MNATDRLKEITELVADIHTRWTQQELGAMAGPGERLTDDYFKLLMQRVKGLASLVTPPSSVAYEFSFSSVISSEWTQANFDKWQDDGWE